MSEHPELLPCCRLCGAPFHPKRKEQRFCSKSCGVSSLVRRRDVLEGLAQQSRLDVSGCWVWTGNLNDSGYGRINVAGRPMRAHRVSYRLFVGLIPDGLTLDHTCRRRACINPQHLEPVTMQENLRRGREARAHD